MDDNKKELDIFGKRLKELREEKKLTQPQLAEKLHTTKQSIWNYEASHRAPDLKMLTEIAKYFNVSTDYLLGRSDFRNTQIEMLYTTITNADNIFKTNVMQLLISRPKEMQFFTDTLLNTNSFAALIYYLYDYKSLSGEKLDGFFKTFNEMSGPQFQNMGRNMIKRNMLMSFIEITLETILDELDNMDGEV